MPAPLPEPKVCTAELLAVLSLGIDLGMGQPMEHIMRQCLIALRIGDALGISSDDRATLYYVALIAWVGCFVDAYEQCKWFGDDTVLRGDFRRVDMAGREQASFMLSHLGAGQTPMQRARLGVAFMTSGSKDARDMLANHWYAADELAARLELGDAVRANLVQTFERWDGKGVPSKVKGDDNLLVTRIINLTDVLEVYHHDKGYEAAIEIAKARRGTQFDPALVDLVCEYGPLLFEDLDEATWERVIEAAPDLNVALTAERFDNTLEAFADFTDMKSPYTLGHSRSVATLAGEAASTFGLDRVEVDTVRRAGLVHDLGRLGVSNTVWDKPGPLTATERERVRLHPYLTDRMLSSCAALVPIAAIAVQHHERLDGSGYPRGLTGDAITPSGRILAAADAYCGKLEPRPHRPALDAGDAAAALRDDVRNGRLDAGAVDAVLRAAGHRVKRRGDWPAGLTTREVEVLRLLARGYSNKEIADQLVISRKTAGNHVEHIYTKIGVSNRARASLFAMKHGLMADGAVDASTRERER